MNLVLPTKSASQRLLLCAVAGLAGLGAQGAELPREQLDFFEKKIRPVLAERCYECHSAAAKKSKGGLTLDTRDGLLKGGDAGPVLVPGDPEKSKLIEAVRYKNRDLQMPPKSPLPPDQVRDLEQWVKLGAPDPRTEAIAQSTAKRGLSVEEGRQFWAFQPLREEKVIGKEASGAKAARASAAFRLSAQLLITNHSSTLDAFINARLAEKKLTAAPPADRRSLLRRATYDLTGLPPTPEEVDAFLADKSPDAFAKVVDRLLNTPGYGERWGRHWLDVARYADSNGLDENVAFGNSWRYRDYVVNSFNADKPYDRFVQEQIAGDLLPSVGTPQRHEQLTALGFLSIGPKLLAEPDKVKLEMDLIDEQIETLGRAFLGMTFGCARCHDHKFDPVPTADYYALAAIFKSTRTMDDLKTLAKWHEPEVATPAERAVVEAHQKKVAEQQAVIAKLVATANKSLVTDKGLKEVPKNAETQYPTNTVAELKQLRADLKKLEDAAPELPSTMGVTDSTNVVMTLPVHIRGSHLTLGKPVPRGFPQVMQVASLRSEMPEKQSGRLELAQWLASPDHPLTARVMVNRIWRWHFGQGLVASTDNFGVLGERPSHPELLDWLALRFIAEGWSVKAMHRLVMNSATYQRASQYSVSSVQHSAGSKPSGRLTENWKLNTEHSSRAALADPENKLLAHFPIRRLEAEEVRDAVLFVAGALDRAMGGKTIPVKNREFFFNHTSKDATTYDSPRRALYLPVVRNNVYDLFEQFDFPDPAVPNGNRNATVVAPQALLMMNSNLVGKSAEKFAAALLASSNDDARRLELAYLKAYARPPTAKELVRAKKFLADFKPDSAASPSAWAVLCQSLLAANEFIYLN
ncbi:MAG: PSD1 domain-containing protein [Verrucomicrobia bacterium]|nr:PSD1 domain-containing protein [Verrucomicrobiota bacterium]